jgi:membrane protein
MELPERPSQLGLRAWWGVLRRTVSEYSDDNLSDWAAALTYYSVLSIFPGLLLLVSVLGLIGQSATQPLIDNLATITPGPVRDILTQGARSLQESQRSSGLLAIVALAAAFWSASGYVAAFIRAANAIYDVPEGRPLWKTLPLRLGMTLVIGTLLAVTALCVVFTGRLAEWVGDLIGAGPVAVTVWDVAKWPVLVLLVTLMLALLYWAAPNARPAGFRWITPGGILAVLVWIIASVGFAVYVSNFESYNKTYGALGSVIVFFVWLYISNIAVLLGAEFDAELLRGRAIVGGMPADQEPFVEMRDAPKEEERQKGLT